MRGLAAGCLLAALVAPMTAAQAAPAATRPGPTGNVPTLGVRLLDAPVSERDDPRAKVYIIDHLAPGAVIDRRIEVSNDTASPVHADMYPAAADISRGSFVGAADRTPDELSSWTTVTPSSAELTAGGRATTVVHIAVPANAEPGERYAVVWAQTASAPQATGVTQVSRVGIRLYLSIGTGSAPMGGFTITSLAAGRDSAGSPTVLASVHNTGGRALDMSGTLQLSGGPGGLSAGPFPVTLGTTLAIGDTEPVGVTLDPRLPAGPWTATITLHSGLIERTASATITFPAAGTAAAVPATPARRARSGPSPAVVVAAVLLVGALLGLVLLVVRARRRRPPPPPPPNRPAVRPPTWARTR